MKSVITGILAFMIPAMAIVACSKKIMETDGDPCKGVMCTMLFAMVNTTVVDNTGSPVALDSFYTLRNSTGQKIYHDKNAMPGGGYTIIDDGYQKQLVNKSDSFYFVGYRNGKQVVYEPYAISADCCHIKKQSGKDSIIIP